MREIKFRVWDKKDKRFIEGGELSFLLYPGNEKWEVSINEQYHRNTDNHGDNNKERFEIMQYTGLKDKNGVEVYEGYIIIPHFENGLYTREECIKEGKDNGFIVIKYDSERGYYFWKTNKNGKQDSGLLEEFSHGLCEVIGNIYSTPDLLTK